MYIHHAIYDLVFKYVGTIEASEVSFFNCYILFMFIWSIFKKPVAFLLIRMLILIKSQGAFKTCSKKTLEWSLSSGERDDYEFFEEPLRACLK